MQQVALGNSSVNIVLSSENTYSRMLSWEVWNFMTITHGKAEFDEQNIINFKGYNDSGKSAMLRALDVLLFNIKANSQVGFIQDDQEYFRVMAYFSDGIIILRDKYINGQSLYEMYKDNQCIFSTRVNGILTKVSDVPQPVKDYLGVLSYEGFNLNSRSCFEKQLLVQTTGSENYKFLNSVLKSEEIALASSMLNTDKNKLGSDITSITTQLDANKALIESSNGLSSEMLAKLKSTDKNLDISEEMLSLLGSYNEKLTFLSRIPRIPELDLIDTSQMDALSSLLRITSQLSVIPSLPEMPSIDTSQLDTLSSITGVFGKLSSLPLLPEMKQVSLEQIDLLAKIQLVFNKIEENNRSITDGTKMLDSLNLESQQIQSVLTEFGQKFVKCTNCGALIEIGTDHID